MKEKLALLYKYMYLLALCIIPLFFLPISADYYDTPKWILFLSLSLASLFLWVRHLLRHLHATLSFGSVTTALSLLTIASILSFLFISTNKIEALVNPFGPATFAALTLLSLTSGTWLTQRMAQRVTWGIAGSSFFLALITVYQAAGMGKIMFPTISFFADPIWTPTGSLVASLGIFILSMPIIIKLGKQALQRKHEVAIALSGIFFVTVLGGIGVSVWLLASRINGALLPIQDGIRILSALKTSIVTMIFGVGAENFLTAFSSGRPISVNETPIWNVRFATNTSFFLHMTTVNGILGGLAAAGCIIALLKNPTTFIGAIFLLFLPPNFSYFSFLFLVFLLSNQANKDQLTKLNSTDTLVNRLAFGVSVITILLGFVFLGRYATGEIYLSTSLKQAQEGRGTDAYHNLTRAITFNPTLSRYHISLSQLSLALAASLAKNIAENDSMTDDAKTHDRDMIAQLVQQAIKEAKIAIALNSQSIPAWENLARTYSQLIGVAQSADAWATTIYHTLITKDPTNPATAVALGGIYIRRGLYTEAIVELRKAVALKHDYATAWYNLGIAYQLQGDIAAANDALQTIFTIAAPGTTDYEAARNALENIDHPTPTPAIPSPTLSLPPEAAP